VSPGHSSPHRSPSSPFFSVHSYLAGVTFFPILILFPTDPSRFMDLFRSSASISFAPTSQIKPCFGFPPGFPSPPPPPGTCSFKSIEARFLWAYREASLSTAVFLLFLFVNSAYDFFDTPSSCRTVLTLITAVTSLLVICPYFSTSHFSLFVNPFLRGSPPPPPSPLPCLTTTPPVDVTGTSCRRFYCLSRLDVFSGPPSHP